MDITVLFFGVLSEITHTTTSVYSGIKSTGELKKKITLEFPEIAHYKFQISVNRELMLRDIELKNGDEVAFLPPFEGG